MFVCGVVVVVVSGSFIYVYLNKEHKSSRLGSLVRMMSSPSLKCGRSTLGMLVMGRTGLHPGRYDEKMNEYVMMCVCV